MVTTAGTAQERAAVRGIVRDSAGRPLPNARVTVREYSHLQLVTAADGRFDLALAYGHHELVFRRLGFRPETASINVPRDSVIEVRMRSDAVTLQAITVVDDRGARVGVRSVTRQSIRNMPAFLEADVFRAVAHVPGVAQPNDLKGRLHLAGGASDETGYELDGHPLQEPFHLAGLIGSFPSSALDRADVAIYHLPAEKDGRLGGVINFETARNEGSDATDLQVGLVSASATALRTWNDARVSSVLGIRSTYLDKLLETFQGSVSRKGDALPLLRYRDLIGSLQVGRLPDSRVSITLFATRDGFVTPGADNTRRLSLRWGEWMGGTRFTRRVGGAWLVSGRVSMSRAHQQTGDGLDSTRIRLRHDWLSSSLSLSRRLASAELSFGATLDKRLVRDRWVLPSGDEFEVVFSPRLPLRASSEGSQRVAALFSEYVMAFDQLEVSAGIRANRIGSDWALAPRVALERPLGEQWRARVSYSRRYQWDAQMEEPQEVNALQPLFLLATPREADMVALSLVGTGKRGGDVRFEASGFAKRYGKRTILVSNPRRYQDSTGTLPAPFPDFDRAAGRAFGGSLDASMRLSSRLYAQGAYTFQRSFESVDGMSPTDWDTPHDGNVFLSYRWSAKWYANLALRAHSGLPLTPARARIFAPRPDLEPDLTPRYLLGELRSARTAGYLRVDIGLRRDWRRGHREWSAGLSLLNASGRTNPYSYDFQSYACWQARECATPEAERRGIPLLPSLFVAVRW